MEHTLYFQIGGISIQLLADFPISASSFTPAISTFQVVEPESDMATLRLVTTVPKLSQLRLGKVVYQKPPWTIYKQTASWVYLSNVQSHPEDDPYLVSIFNNDYSLGTIYRSEDYYKRDQLETITTFSSDQIYLAQILANHHACVLHASGIIINGKGLLFIGHSGAGKSTMIKLLYGLGEILCDDRIILRSWPEGYRIHGTWSHGELSDVSPANARLHAILYLEQASTNELIPLVDNQERLGKMLSHVVKPLISADWWEKILDVVGKAAAEVPTYQLRFDKSGQVVDLIQQLCADEHDV